MKKSFIRNKVLNLRKRVYSKNLSINSDKFIKFLERKKIKSKIIGGYYPFNYELDVMNILYKLEKKDYIISLPKVEKNNTMNFFHWSVGDPLKINKYGIPETISKKKIYPGILLVPLVAFDRNLNRLGYGGGYYDRYISKFKNDKMIIKIGIGFSIQKVKSIPINGFDKKMDYIITEKEFI